MSEIDIRQGVETKVTSIRFSDRDSLNFDNDYTDVVSLRDSYATDTEFDVYTKDIPNLILALQKALELWGDDK